MESQLVQLLDRYRTVILIDIAAHFIVQRAPYWHKTPFLLVQTSSVAKPKHGSRGAIRPKTVHPPSQHYGISTRGRHAGYLVFSLHSHSSLHVYGVTLRWRQLVIAQLHSMRQWRNTNRTSLMPSRKVVRAGV